MVADDSVRFVTCTHCATPLEIVREATQTHSRIMHEIHAATTESAKSLKVIQLQNDLERLDREWSKSQSMGVPDEKSGCDFLGMLFVAGILGVVVGISMVVSGLYQGVYKGAAQGAVFFVIGAALAILLRGRATLERDLERQRTAAENDHQIQRQSLLRRIEEARSTS